MYYLPKNAAATFNNISAFNNKSFRTIYQQNRSYCGDYLDGFSWCSHTVQNTETL
ncbi:hypothetical protein CBL_08832 [Carabus blaptoides fortunei]